ncbi:MAG TPA: hypothetical protein VG457_00665, partial [Planctomycetota bacterium]|nr:hypothetical protein [Planctomycetota bacterium]
MSRNGVLLCLMLSGCVSPEVASAPTLILYSSAEFSIGETLDLALVDGSQARVKLLDLRETLDDVNGAVRKASVTVEVNGQTSTLVSGTYRLPTTLGGVQIDCPITKGYLSKGSRKNIW